MPEARQALAPDSQGPGRAASMPGPLPSRLPSRFVRTPVVIGVLVQLVLVAAALWGRVDAPFPPMAQDFAVRFAGPNGQHLLGTDHFGRDILSRLLTGAGLTLTVAVASTVAACLLGVPLGALAASSGVAGSLTARGLDVLQSFPTLVLALVLITVMGGSYAALVAAIAAGFFPYVARVAEAVFRTEASRDYVLAARALGRSSTGIVVRHILPNSVSAFFVQATEVYAAAILSEATLSFLGLGPAASSPTWGRMLFDARPYFELAPHTVLPPLVAIVTVVLGANLLGDGLRDALDPFTVRTAGRRS